MSKDRYIVIHSCFDCPHCYYDDNCHIIGYCSCYRCMVNEKELSNTIVNKEVPDWCPLEVYENG